MKNILEQLKNISKDFSKEIIDLVNDLYTNKQTQIMMIGSHGTGKSTLANKLAEELDLTVVESVARILDKPLEYISSEITRQEIICETSIWDFKRWKNVDAVFTRTPLDTLAYAMSLPYSNKREELMEDVTTKIIHDTDVMKMIRNGIFVYLPIEFGLEDDGTRPIGDTYQKLIDENMRRVLNQFGITPLVVTGSVEERVRTVLEYIDKSSI